jgi:predicted metalloprotease
MFLGGENVQMLTPLLEQINRGEKHDRTKGSNCKEEQAFIRTIVADNEDVWTTIFKENNLNYRRPNIVLFSGGVETACGNATSDSGPTAQQTKSVYGFVFFEELKTRFGAQGGGDCLCDDCT